MELKSLYPVFISLIILGLIIGLEPLYRQKLYNYSLDFIPAWQDNGGSDITNLMKFISLFGSTNVQAGLIAAIYCFASRRFTIKMLFTVFITQNILTFFKMFYHNPRPFFSSEDVDAKSCSIGYGNPSGHCLLVIGMYGTLWTLMFQNNTEPGKPFFSKDWKKALIKWISFGVYITIIVLTFIARMYLGSHGINQTIYGSLLGLWVAINFGFILPKFINDHFDNFVSYGKICGEVNVGFILIVTTFFVLQVLNMILFFILQYNETYFNDDWAKMLSLKCPKNKSKPLEDSFKGSLHASLYAFFYFSMLIEARVFPKAFNYWYSNIGAVKLIIRTLIVGAVAGCCYIPYFLASGAEFPVKMGVAIFTTNVLIGLCAVPLTDWLTEKFGLVRTSCEVKNVSAKV